MHVSITGSFDGVLSAMDSASQRWLRLFAETLCENEPAPIPAVAAALAQACDAVSYSHSANEFTMLVRVAGRLWVVVVQHQGLHVLTSIRID